MPGTEVLPAEYRLYEGFAGVFGELFSSVILVQLTF